MKDPGNEVDVFHPERERWTARSCTDSRTDSQSLLKIIPDFVQEIKSESRIMRISECSPRNPVRIPKKCYNPQFS